MIGALTSIIVKTGRLMQTSQMVIVSPKDRNPSPPTPSPKRRGGELSCSPSPLRGGGGGGGWRRRPFPPARTRPAAPPANRRYRSVRRGRCADPPPNGGAGPAPWFPG